MIDSTLNPSDIDKPAEQVSTCSSSGDLSNTCTLWLTGKNMRFAQSIDLQSDYLEFFNGAV